MITEEILHKLNPYSTSSWAIWNENDENDLPFFLSRTEKLRNDVVFLGLNRSGIHKLGFGNFQNFHAKGHRGDAELKKLIQDQNLVNLTGAYMTDLSEIFETNSKKVEINTIASGKKLEEQLTLLGSGKFTVICFGGDVFKEIISFYKAETYLRYGMDFARIERNFQLEIFKLYHYSLNGFNNKNVKEKLPVQLADINNSLSLE